MDNLVKYSRSRIEERHKLSKKRTPEARSSLQVDEGSSSFIKDGYFLMEFVKTRSDAVCPETALLPELLIDLSL